MAFFIVGLCFIYLVTQMLLFRWEFEFLKTKLMIFHDFSILDQAVFELFTIKNQLFDLAGQSHIYLNQVWDWLICIAWIYSCAIGIQYTIDISYTVLSMDVSEQVGLQVLFLQNTL